MATRRVSVGPVQVAGPTVRVHCRGPEGEFVETLDFGVAVPSDRSTAQLLQLLAVAVTTSYAKVAPFDELVLPAGSDDALVEYTAALYDHGLREYRYRNGLPLDRPPGVVVGAHRWFTPDSRMAPGDAVHPTGSETEKVGGAVVAIGGGKDSALTLRVVRPDLFAGSGPVAGAGAYQPGGGAGGGAASGGVIAACVNPSPAVTHLCGASGAALHGIRRVLDPRLGAVTAAGGLNGHIPVTSINSAALALLAQVTGREDVVFANERSAEEPTRVVDGLAVNHQWSKTLAFEERFAALVAPLGLRYWSLTRGMSDIAVASRVVGDGTLVEHFLSCNRAFRLADLDAGVDNRGAWCGDCDKCAFTYLTFALFLAPDRLTAIFGTDMLANPATTELFAALATPGAKPFDCVGEIDESRAAIGHLAASRTWGDSPVVRAVAALGQGAPPATAFLALGPDRVPATFREELDGVAVAALVP